MDPNKLPIGPIGEHDLQPLLQLLLQERQAARTLLGAMMLAVEHATTRASVAEEQLEQVLERVGELEAHRALAERHRAQRALRAIELDELRSRLDAWANRAIRDLTDELER